MLKWTNKQRDVFWSKVNKNGPIHPYKPELGNCWLWIGCINKGGYGRIKFNQKEELAHRASYQLSFGEIQDDKSMVCHTCDVRSCVNSAHLYAGTHQDNMSDKKARGLHLSENHKKKLSIALTGRVCSKETREKLSISHVGISKGLGKKKSGYKNKYVGVSYDKSRDRYIAHYRSKRIGRFDTEREAYDAYLTEHERQTIGVSN